jgi:hypothetical protein
MDYDIFNGDADGIFSLHQYRLENPLPNARLITGVKRDIWLLARLEDVTDSALAVFDISFDSNRASLLKILGNNNRVVYFDHHFAGEGIDALAIQAYLDPSPRTCTSLIVNAALGGSHGLWAICGAFGDNLLEPALALAQALHLGEKQIHRLRELGEMFNYNGYGEFLDDLHFHPQKLYEAVQPYANPFDFYDHSQQLATLRTGYQSDLAQAMNQQELKTFGKNRIYCLPNESWARRVAGVFSNFRARERVAAAHVVITENRDKTLRISVRAPLAEQRHADTLCKLYPTGGGRAAAAGINSLPAEMLGGFLDTFQSFYCR